LSTPDPVGAAGVPAELCSQANGGDDPPAGWLRVNAGTRELLLAALRIASDGIDDDLDCVGCSDGGCTEGGHRQFRPQSCSGGDPRCFGSWN